MRFAATTAAAVDSWTKATAAAATYAASLVAAEASDPAETSGPRDQSESSADVEAAELQDRSATTDFATVTAALERT